MVMLSKTPNLRDIHDTFTWIMARIRQRSRLAWFWVSLLNEWMNEYFISDNKRPIWTQYIHIADDCQVYVSVPVTDAAAAIDRFSRYVADVSTWLSSSRLRLNPAKTVVMWFGGRQQVANITVDNIPVLSSTVTTVASARDLGVVVDSQLTMSANVSSTCRSAYH